MAEIQSRPSTSTRGRGSGRGGRGGLSSRGGRASTRSANTNTNGDSPAEDEGEIGSLKKKYYNEISQIREIFPGWSDVDLAFALQETSGDVDSTVTRIMDGSISQWGEVASHKKHHGRTKPKESAAAPETTASKPARGARTESGRGGRGRATERGGRGAPRTRGASHVTSNGNRHKENQALSIPTENAWGNATPSEDWGTQDTKPASTWKKPVAAPAAAPAAPKAVPVKTWASMLRQSTEPKPAPKAVESPAPKPAEHVEPHPAEEPESHEPQPAEPDSVAGPEHETEKIEEEQDSSKAEAATIVPTVVEPEIALLPSKDRLTETNLEQVTDTSNPPPTATAASTTADSWDPRENAPTATATPVSASQQHHKKIIKTITSASVSVGSGYAATAHKATERVSRGSSHHQRRILDQEEAVRMPGHREVDRATVQFGAFSLGDAEEDVDEDREEAETRAQPPADSPVAHPRASLPPAQPAPVPEAFPTAKQAAPVATGAASNIPTGPAAASGSITAAPPTGPSAPAAVPTGPAGAPTQPAAAIASHQPPQAAQQYGRFAQPGAQDQPGFSQKSYDSFAGQASTASVTQSQSQYDSGLPAQVSQAQQGPIQQPTGAAFSSAPNDYPPYYATAEQSTRGGPYNNNSNSYYAQQYGASQQAQQSGQGQPPQAQQVEGSLASQQPRGFGGYNNPQNENLSQYPQSSAQASRFGAAAAAVAEAQNSGGNNTPNPTQNQAVAGQGSQQQSHGQQPSHGQFGGGAGGAGSSTGAAGGGGYNNHPYYSSPYYSNFMYGQSSYGGNYGGGPYGKGGGAYGQPHQYGMSPQGAPFDHSSSGNAAFGQGSLHRGDSGLSSGLGGDYQRGGSSQMGNQPGLGGAAGSFGGGMQDAFGRGGGSGYPSQAGPGSYSAQGNQPGNAGSGVDDLKPPYGDSKTAGGPSPSLSAAARPGSAANTAASQSGLPPPQSNQPGMGGYGGGYPNHHQGQHGMHGNGSQSASSGAGYGMGGGGGQNHAFPYGNQYAGQSYYSNQQQRGGWGGNYH